MMMVTRTTTATTSPSVLPYKSSNNNNQKRKRTQRGYWWNRQSHVDFVKQEMSSMLQVHHWEQWYDIKASDILKLDGPKHYYRSLMQYYDGLVSNLVSSVYPDKHWQMWKFEEVPAGFWDRPENGLQFMNWVAGELDILQWEDWYKIRRQDIGDRGGWSLLNKYQGSPSLILRTVYPQYTWKTWKFHQVFDGFWQNPSNQKAFVEDLAKQLNIKDPRDWYTVSSDEITRHGGSTLLNSIYHGTPALLMKATMPEYPWQWWKFARVNRSMWLDKDRQMEFMQWIATEIGLNHQIELWQHIPSTFIRQHGGTPLLEIYGTKEALLQSLLVGGGHHLISSDMNSSHHHQMMIGPHWQQILNTVVTPNPNNPSATSPSSSRRDIGITFSSR